MFDKLVEMIRPKPLDPFTEPEREFMIKMLEAVYLIGLPDDEPLTPETEEQLYQIIGKLKNKEVW